MDDASGRADAPNENNELPPALAAWLAIEKCVAETSSALEALDDDTEHAALVISGIHRAVRVWLSWEFWATLLDPGQYSPDSLLSAVPEQGVDVCQVGRSSPATPPRPGQGSEWRAFEGGDDRG